MAMSERKKAAQELGKQRKAEADALKAKYAAKKKAKDDKGAAAGGHAASNAAHTTFIASYYG